MNMKGTQQAIKNNKLFVMKQLLSTEEICTEFAKLADTEISELLESEYISLYNYLGESTAGTELPKQVSDAAVKLGIKIKYQQLPKDVRRNGIYQVHTYPIAFLDLIFNVKNETNPMGVPRRRDFDQLVRTVTMLETRILDLERRLSKQVNDQLNLDISKPVSNTDWEDDLPF